MSTTLPRLRYKAGTGGFRTDDLKFFTDKSGEPIKFRVQPGFHSYLQQKLERAISTYGGLVISKIPVRGIVVVDPKSKAGKELVKSWKWKERRKRHFVGYDFVLKCAEEKRMLPIVNYSLNYDNLKNRLGKTSTKAQRELSEKAKDKLALYLATRLPENLKNSLSSNQIYKDLVKNSKLYPWVKKYTWQTFRNYYCKNKKYIDKLIGYIIAASPMKATDSRGRVSQRQVKPAGQKNLIVQKKGGKTVELQSDNASYDKKRKFADNRTNIGQTNKKMKTIDELLHKPLPIFEVHKAKLKVRPKNIVASESRHQAPDLDKLEVGRSTKRSSHARDIWIDDKFQGKGVLKPIESPRIDSRDSLALVTPQLDLDDLRSAVALDSTLFKDDDDDAEDEDYVARLLGLTDQPLGPTPKPDENTTAAAVLLTCNEYPGPTGNSTTALGNRRKIEIEILARDSQFTTEEVSLKLAAFAGNMDKTRKFFIRCRNIIDEQFAESLKDDSTSGALNLSTAVLRPVTADSGTQENFKGADTSSESFPARNTRARKAARAAKATLKM